MPGHLSRSHVGLMQDGVSECAVLAGGYRRDRVCKQVGCGQLIGGQEPVSEVPSEVYSS